MKNLFILLFIVGCGQNKTEVISKYGDGQVRTEKVYLSSKENFLKRMYYENGKIKYEIHYENNIENGKAVYYYDNGSKLGENTFKNGKVDGIGFEYFRNGNVRVAAKQEMGKLIDTAKYYFENGKLNREVLYNDNKVTVLNLWDSSGTQKIKNGISN